ncbi:MAG: gamma-butyrobetaine hydroxylase-like domain-containing protein, partial [Candidatus Thiodiazotropha sp. 6PLUC5]
MTTETPTPIEINLHRKSRLLALRFSDGANFELPCEYLRVFSTAAEVKASKIPVTGKE